jgi:hypothetical protein
MWVGQLANEGFNTLLKRVVKQNGPDGVYGNINSNTALILQLVEMATVSSHGQYMGYFAAFHISIFFHWLCYAGCVRHCIVYSVLYSWAGAVAYSRYVLPLCILYMNVTRVVALDNIWYHNKYQILWGLSARHLVSLSTCLQNSFQLDDQIHFSDDSRPSF